MKAFGLSGGSSRRQLGSVTSVLILMLGFSTAAAQPSHSFYLSTGPAATASSDWGDGHKLGWTAEFGVLLPVSTTWTLVNSLGVEGFQLDLPEPSPLGPGGSSGRWANLRGGNDVVVSLRSGFRHGFAAQGQFRPYVGAALGVSVARLDAATADWLPDASSGVVLQRQTVQDSNNELGVGLSGLLGVTRPAGRSLQLFLEAGYTFVFTPDDSFDDNPSFFPVRIGVMF